MYLCDNKDGIIDIYSVEKKDSDLKRYKSAQLIGNTNGLFYKYSSNDSVDVNAVYRGQEILLSNKSKLEVDTYERDYPYSEKQLIQEALLIKYLKDELSNARMASIYDGKKAYDLIITTAIKLGHYQFDNFDIENMICLPNNLAIIQMIEGANWERLYKRVYGNNLDISEQLDLFRIQYLTSIDSNKLDMLYNAGILRDGDYNRAKLRLEESSKVLKLFR